MDQLTFWKGVSTTPSKTLRRRRLMRQYARESKARHPPSPAQRERDKARARLYTRKNVLGILDATDEIRYGVCPICKRGPLKLDCDHWHEIKDPAVLLLLNELGVHWTPGKTRGWVCPTCNKRIEKWLWLEAKHDEIVAYLKAS